MEDVSYVSYTFNGPIIILWVFNQAFRSFRMLKVPELLAHSYAPDLTGKIQNRLHYQQMFCTGCSSETWCQHRNKLSVGTSIQPSLICVVVLLKKSALDLLFKWDCDCTCDWVLDWAVINIDLFFIKADFYYLIRWSLLFVLVVILCPIGSPPSVVL